LTWWTWYYIRSSIRINLAFVGNFKMSILGKVKD
jgi:hypothetical protein